MRLEYSVTIRTTGRGGAKYQKLLNSIAAQTIQPSEVLIVLPEGAQYPRERLGTEKFLFAQKGMMTQRIFGVESAKSEIVLCCDDDIEFDSAFAEKLLAPIECGICDIALGELLALLPQKSLKNIMPILSLSAIPMTKRAGMYVKIIRSGGWKYYRFDSKISQYLPTESAAGAMLMITKNAWNKIALSNELWAQHGTNAPMDDQIMFYKAHLLGLRTCVVTDAHYVHNDEKSSLVGENADLNKSYNSGFNHRIFWHRFIYQQQQGSLAKIWTCCLFLYKTYVGMFFQLLTSIYKKERRKQVREQFKGDAEAKRFLNSEDYLKLTDLK